MAEISGHEAGVLSDLMLYFSCAHRVESGISKRPAQRRGQLDAIDAMRLAAPCDYHWSATSAEEHSSVGVHLSDTMVHLSGPAVYEHISLARSA